MTDDLPLETTDIRVLAVLAEKERLSRNYITRIADLIGPDKDIPHVSAEVIVKYVTDLELLGLL